MLRRLWRRHDDCERRRRVVILGRWMLSAEFGKFSMIFLVPAFFSCVPSVCSCELLRVNRINANEFSLWIENVCAVFSWFKFDRVMGISVQQIIELWAETVWIWNCGYLKRVSIRFFEFILFSFPFTFSIANWMLQLISEYVGDQHFSLSGQNAIRSFEISAISSCALFKIKHTSIWRSVHSTMPFNPSRCSTLHYTHLSSCT